MPEKTTVKESQAGRKRKEKTRPDWDKLTKEDLQKLEIAQELGYIDKIKQGGYGNLTAQESGRIGGIIAGQHRKKSSQAIQQGLLQK